MRALLGNPNVANHAPVSDSRYPSTVKMDTAASIDTFRKTVKLTKRRHINIPFVTKFLSLLRCSSDFLVLITIRQENVTTDMNNTIIIEIRKVVKIDNPKVSHCVGGLMKRQAPVLDSNILTCVSKRSNKKTKQMRKNL